MARRLVSVDENYKFPPPLEERINQNQDVRMDARLQRMQNPALNAWHDALANTTNSPAQAIVIGDSISEGADAGVVTNRWQNVVQKYLRQEYGVPTGASFPFIPLIPGTSGASAWPVVRTGVDGTITPDVNWGFGWRAGKIFIGGAATFTFTGTSAAVMFTKASGVGLLRVRVDGGTPVVVDTNSVTNGPTADAATYNTGPLTPGQHTVTVSFDPSTPSHITSVVVHGLLTWNGDESKGIRFIDSAHSGFRSANFTANGARTTANALKAAGGASLAIIGIGTNDTLYPQDFPNYRANVERMISQLRSVAGFTGSVVLVNWYLTNQMTEEQWAPYGEVMAQIAAGDPRVSFLDMRRHMPDMPSPYTAPEGLGYFAGNVHPNGRGYKHIAGVMADYLSGRA